MIHMERLHNGFTLELCPGTFPLSTDSMVLSGFVRLPKDARVLDLGAGCGTLGLLLCASRDDCTVTGVEIDPEAHQMAQHNAQANKITTRLQSICADLRTIPDFIAPGSFSCCVSNPPYFSAGPESKSHPVARREDLCSPEDLFRAAGWALKYGGDFFLIHRPERLGQLCACAAKENMEAKRLWLVRHQEGGDITLIALQFRKGGKPGLKIEERCLYNRDGSPSDFYTALYHISK